MTAPMMQPTYTIEDSDELLLTQYARSGDRKLFETLVRRYEREIYSYLRRYIGQDEMAEDAFQGTFLQVHMKCGQFDPARRVRPWLYAIATNQAIDAQRRQNRRRSISLDTSTSDGDGGSVSWADQLVSKVDNPLDVASQNEDSEQLRQAVASLGDSLQRVIQLVYFQGLKYREAAEVLGIPVGTVKSRVHAAVTRLSEYWQAQAEASEQLDTVNR